MTRTRIAAAVFSALALSVAWAPRAAAQQASGFAEAGEDPERYAQPKVVEGNVILKKGETDETLTRGIPVAEGDVVESHGRGILQLGDGSAVAFGSETRFKVAALFSDQDQVRRVLLILDRGVLRVRKGTNSDALIRVDTPSGSGTLGDRGASTTRPDATFQVSSDMKGAKVVFLVHGGQAGFSNTRAQTQVFAGQRLTVYGADDGLDRVADFNAFSMDDFDQWAEDLVKPRPTESASRVPQEIRYYADDLDSTGRWVYVDDCSTWCWTPSGVAADWRPYCDGRWGAYDSGLTWISAEPWGFVTCHYGRWGWGARLGWYWIPGVSYSPAWVAWNCTGSYFGWAPLGYYNQPCRWGYGPWAGGTCWNVVNVNYVSARGLRNRYYNDPGVLRAFSGPSAGFQGRVVVTGAEFRNPTAFHHVVSEPGVLRERVVAYARVSEAASGHPLFVPQGRAAAGVAFNHTERAGAAQSQSSPLMRTQTPRQSAFSEAGSRRAYSEERHAAPRQDFLQRAPQRTSGGDRFREEAAPAPNRMERMESPRMERPSPRQDAPRVDHPAAPRQEAPRMDHPAAPRQEAPRVEHQAAPRQEAPRESGRERK